jgi:putative transposase
MTISGDYRRGRHVVSALQAHLLFVTKYRRGVLDADMLWCCEGAMPKVRGNFGAERRELNGQDDHLHLLVEYPPKVPVSALANNLKGVSVRRLRPEFTGQINRHMMHGHLWPPPYLAASCGGAPLDIIHQYAEQQRRSAKATSGPIPP